MTNKKIGCIGVVLFLLLCGSLFLNFLLASLAVSKVGGNTAMLRSERAGKYTETRVWSGSGDGKIVRIDLRGVITSNGESAFGDSMVDDLKIALEQAAADDSVSAVVLHIDSPGGEVTASDVIYNAVRQLDERKPVIVHMGSLAASGGYYAACGGRYLMASPTTITGSIGVIIQTLNYQDLFGKIGLDSVVFKSGEFKDILSGAREMTPAEREYIQGLVMQTYDRFVGVVADARQMARDELVNGVADGRIVSGTDALESGLIDGLGYIEDAYRKAMEIGGVEDADVVRYTVPMNFGNILRLLGEGGGDERVEIDLLGGRVPRLDSGRLYYLPELFAP